MEVAEETKEDQAEGRTLRRGRSSVGLNRDQISSTKSSSQVLEGSTELDISANQTLGEIRCLPEQSDTTTPAQIQMRKRRGRNSVEPNHVTPDLQHSEIGQGDNISKHSGISAEATNDSAVMDESGGWRVSKKGVTKGKGSVMSKKGGGNASRGTAGVLLRIVKNKVKELNAAKSQSNTDTSVQSDAASEDSINIKSKTPAKESLPKMTKLVNAPLTPTTTHPPRVSAGEMDPMWLKPFEIGWQRSIVRRSINAGSSQTCDIYYHSPEGVKLRSMREVIEFLQKSASLLSAECFTYRKQVIHREPFEIVRDAKFQSPRVPAASPSPNKKVKSPVNKTGSIKKKKEQESGEISNSEEISGSQKRKSRKSMPAVSEAVPEFEEQSTAKQQHRKSFDDTAKLSKVGRGGGLKFSFHKGNGALRGVIRKNVFKSQKGPHKKSAGVGGSFRGRGRGGKRGGVTSGRGRGIHSADNFDELMPNDDLSMLTDQVNFDDSVEDIFNLSENTSNMLNDSSMGMDWNILNCSGGGGDMSEEHKRDMLKAAHSQALKAFMSRALNSVSSPTSVAFSADQRGAKMESPEKSPVKVSRKSPLKPISERLHVDTSEAILRASPSKSKQNSEESSKISLTISKTNHGYSSNLSPTESDATPAVKKRGRPAKKVQPTPNLTPKTTSGAMPIKKAKKISDAVEIDNDIDIVSAIAAGIPIELDGRIIGAKSSQKGAIKSSSFTSRSARKECTPASISEVTEVDELGGRTRGVLATLMSGIPGRNGVVGKQEKKSLGCDVISDSTENVCRKSDNVRPFLLLRFQSAGSRVKGLSRLCGLDCPGRSGFPPTLYCQKCTLAYHHQCIGLTRLVCRSTFVCPDCTSNSNGADQKSLVKNQMTRRPGRPKKSNGSASTDLHSEDSTDSVLDDRPFGMILSSPKQVLTGSEPVTSPSSEKSQPVVTGQSEVNNEPVVTSSSPVETSSKETESIQPSIETSSEPIISSFKPVETSSSTECDEVSQESPCNDFSLPVLNNTKPTQGLDHCNSFDDLCEIGASDNVTVAEVDLDMSQDDKVDISKDGRSDVNSKILNENCNISASNSKSSGVVEVDGLQNCTGKVDNAVVSNEPLNSSFDIFYDAEDEVTNVQDLESAESVSKSKISVDNDLKTLENKKQEVEADKCESSLDKLSSYTDNVGEAIKHPGKSSLIDTVDTLSSNTDIADDGVSRAAGLTSSAEHEVIGVKEPEQASDYKELEQVSEDSDDEMTNNGDLNTSGSIHLHLSSDSDSDSGTR